MKRPKRRAIVQVRAAREGVFVPVEGNPRTKIGAEPVSVAWSPYYAKQEADGDIEIVAVEPEEVVS